MTYYSNFEAPVKPTRSREGQRRRTALVTYNPNLSGNSLEYDDLGTMNDIEVSSFQRGGFSRTSLPVVRSASTSLERPLGLVFLVYGDQTKKSLLPNEITTLDTVRALFVRAFPDLTLEVLENPRKKIYLLDPATNIYFQLEDLADIKDRSVLKLHDTDNDQPQKVKERQEVRGRTVQMPASRSHSRPVYGEVPLGHKEFIKSQSMPPQAAHGYQELMQDQRNQLELERRSRSRTPEPADRSHRSLSAGSSSRQRFSHSPDRLPTPDRVHLNSIPENRQIPLGYKDQSNYYETVGPGIYRGQYPSGIYDSPVPYQGYPSASPIPSQQAYVACSTRALPSMAYPQRAVAPGFDMNAGFQRSQSYRILPTERDGKDLSRSHSVTPSDDTARNRIEKMEQQLANLTAWVHYQKDGTRREVIPASRSLVRTASDSSDTLPSSSASKNKGGTTPISTIASSTNHVVHSQGLSDIHDGQRSSGLSSRESTPLSAQAEISAKLAGLRYDLHILRKQQQLNMEAMKDEFAATLSKIKEVLSSLPEAENQANFQKLTKAAITKSSYISDKQHVDRKLGELEVSIEGLRTDVISKQYQVNTADVEGIAQLLNNITKSLADLKAQFTDIHGQMKHVLDEEMKILVSEEKFLKEEPTQIENSLKRCKNISDSLLNLQRLTSGQDQRSSFAPSVEVSSDRKLLPAKTETLVPDQDLRAKEREVGDKSNDKKEQISSRHEAPRLNKRSEMASRNLQPSVTDVSSEKKEVDRRIDIGSRAQPSQEKPVAPAKSVILLNTATTHMSTAATTTRVPSAATVSSVPSLSSASNVASVKPSYSAASTPAKPPEKPTATVSAMTAGVSDTVTTTPTKAAEKESSSPIMKNVFIPLTQTTGRLTSTALAGTDTGNQSPKDGTKSPKKKDTTVYTYQVCGPVNPVFPIPPVFDKPENLDVTSSSKDSPTELKDKSKSESSTRGTNRPPDLSLGKADSVKKGSVSFSDPPVTNIASVDNNSSSKTVNGHSVDKVPLAAQKQTARSAFFSSVNSSSNSPSSPNRNSVSLDPGPVLSPTGVVGKKTEGPTINLVLTGSVSPMSPTNQGSFNVTPPVELNSLRAVENRTSSSTTNFPAHGISNSDVDNNSSYDSQSSTSSDSSSKHKKVPPPPPPRQGSRPQSASILPVNGVPPDLSVQQSREMPRFVGGILGQHRSSGGPLFSTPKPLLQQKSVSRNDQDINSATYININQPDVQSQKNSSQQISDANTQNNANAGDGSAIPSLSSFSAVLNRGKRDSSSESSSSSSGTMGSQQSVVTVVRSSSVTIKDSSKSKPDPPKRHSSLLSKFTGSKESKSKIKNGKAKVNGVDF